MDFETWWASFWKRTGQPEVFDLAFKEIAQKAWDAGNVQGFSDGYETAKDDLTDE